MPVYSSVWWIGIFWTSTHFLITVKHVFNKHRIGGVIVSVLASSAVDRGFEPRSGQTIEYKIDICCFSAKQTALRRKSKDCLAWNQDNVFAWSDMSTHGLLFQWASTIKIQLSMLLVGLVQSSPWYTWKIAELNNNHLLTQQIQNLPIVKTSQYKIWIETSKTEAI